MTALAIIIGVSALGFVILCALSYALVKPSRAKVLPHPIYDEYGNCVSPAEDWIEKG